MASPTTEAVVLRGSAIVTKEGQEWLTIVFEKIDMVRAKVLQRSAVECCSFS